MKIENIRPVSFNDFKHDPNQLVKEVLKLIAHSERLSEDLKIRFDEIIREWHG